MSAPAMNPDSQAAAMLDAVLNRLSIDYWHDVDHNAGRGAHAFFVEDGARYQIHDQVFDGREAIRAFYSWRESRGERVARHCIVNGRSVLQADGTATMQSVLLLYAADGRPILPSAPPIQIADLDDVCELRDGVWKYRSRRITTLFAGGVPITLPS